MPNTPFTSSSLEERLAEIQEEAEKKKVKLTPEIQQYIREHLEAVQEKLVNGKPVFEEDMEFMEEVRMWVGMPKGWREKWSSIEKMKGSEIVQDIIREAQKRHISIKQCVDLLHVMKAAEKEKDWIDKTFDFPGDEKIGVKENLRLAGRTSLARLPEGLSVMGGYLSLRNCTSLTRLPDGLSVGGDLYLEFCRSLTSLPKGLLVGGDLWLSKNMKKQVQKDAERLKREGKIKGAIKFRND